MCKDIKEELQFELEQWFLDNLNPYPPNGYNISKNADNGGFCDIIYHKKVQLKYDEEKIILAKKLLSEEIPLDDVSNVTGIKNKDIHNIFNLNSYKEIGVEYNEKIIQYKNFERKLKRSKINFRDITAFIKLHKLKFSFEQIADIFDLDENVVRQCHNYELAKIEGRLKQCCVCGKDIILKKNNNRKYCKECSKIMKNNKNLRIKYKNIKKEDLNKSKITNKQELKNKEIMKNKDKIINMYENKNLPLYKIIKELSIKGITNKDIKDYLQKWGIKIKTNRDYIRKNKDYILYNGVFDRENNIIQTFKFKFDTRDWIIKNGICETDIEARNIMQQSNKNNTYYKDYLFKDITNKEYEKFKHIIK